MKRIFIAIFATAVLAIAQQTPPSPAAPVQMVVTAEAKHGSQVPVVHREDVQVYEGKDRDEVKDWGPLPPGHSKLEFFVLIDDAASTNTLGTQLRTLSDFITKEEAATSMGVAYMTNGGVSITQNLTNDHAQAAKALRLPFGNAGASPSPYLSLTDLIKRWPRTDARREVLMISDGVDRLYGPGPSDPYVDEAISTAQKEQVIVFSIYTPGEGHMSHSFWRLNWGQGYLSQLSDETGGESYNLGPSPPVSFTGYLEDLSARLNRQYLLTFIPKPGSKAELRSVRVRTERKDVDLAAADRVYVPAAH